MPDIAPEGDSKLARYRAQADRLIAEFDRNGDAAVDLEEARERVVGYSAAHEIRERQNRRLEFDVTYRDSISLDAARLKDADADGDGRLTAEEAARRYAAAADSDGDGKLSLWERIVRALRDWFTSGAYGYYARHHTREVDRRLVSDRPIPDPWQQPTTAGPDRYEPAATPAPGVTAEEVDGLLHDLDTNGDGRINRADDRWYQPLRNSARRELATRGVHDLDVQEASRKARKALGQDGGS